VTRMDSWVTVPSSAKAATHPHVLEAVQARQHAGGDGRQGIQGALNVPGSPPGTASPPTTAPPPPRCPPAKRDLPAVAARQPQAQPRDPHGRDHSDPPHPQPGPRLLPAEARRGQDPQGSAVLPEAADQRRHLRPATRRRPHEGPGRATGEPLCLQGSRAHTPHTGSSGKPLPGPRPAYDPRQDTRCPYRSPSVSEEGPESHLTTTKAKRFDLRGRNLRVATTPATDNRGDLCAYRLAGWLPGRGW
jgi:hypothetical protein